MSHEGVDPAALKVAMRAQFEQAVQKEKDCLPRSAPPIPHVKSGLMRTDKRSKPELRDLDLALRGKFYKLFEDPAVIARVQGLLTSGKDEIVINTLKVILPAILMQRREGETGPTGGVNINLGIPRPKPEPAVDITPR